MVVIQQGNYTIVTELHTLKWLVLWYVDFTLIKVQITGEFYKAMVEYKKEMFRYELLLPRTFFFLPHIPFLICVIINLGI